MKISARPPLPEKIFGGPLDIDVIVYSLKDVTVANVTAFAHIKKLKYEQSFFVYYEQRLKAIYNIYYVVISLSSCSYQPSVK